jgi:hypothetical protein
MIRRSASAFHRSDLTPKIGSTNRSSQRPPSGVLLNLCQPDHALVALAANAEVLLALALEHVASDPLLGDLGREREDRIADRHRPLRVVLLQRPQVDLLADEVGLSLPG